MILRKPSFVKRGMFLQPPNYKVRTRKKAARYCYFKYQMKRISTWHILILNLLTNSSHRLCSFYLSAAPFRLPSLTYITSWLSWFKKDYIFSDLFLTKEQTVWSTSYGLSSKEGRFLDCTIEFFHSIRSFNKRNFIF